MPLGFAPADAARGPRVRPVGSSSEGHTDVPRSFADDAIELAAQAAVVARRDPGSAWRPGLLLPDPPAAQILADLPQLIDTVLAPAFLVPADVAAVAEILSADAILIGQAAVVNSPGGGPTSPSPSSPSPLAPAARDVGQAFYAAAISVTTALPFIASPGRQYAAFLARALCAATEAAYLGQAFLAEARSNFTDRQSALDAQGRIAAALDGARDRIARCAGSQIYGILADAAQQATAYIVAIATDLKPIVRVKAPRSAPSTALAYALYGDPERGAELALRNSCATSLFMPAEFEALAPDPSS